MRVSVNKNSPFGRAQYLCMVQTDDRKPTPYGAYYYTREEADEFKRKVESGEITFDMTQKLSVERPKEDEGNTVAVEAEESVTEARNTVPAPEKEEKTIEEVEIPEDDGLPFGFMDEPITGQMCFA